MATRKQHPRIRFSSSSSPEQGEVSDEKRQRDEKDSSVNRHRQKLISNPNQGDLLPKMHRKGDEKDLQTFSSIHKSASDRDILSKIHGSFSATKVEIDTNRPLTSGTKRPSSVINLIMGDEVKRKRISPKREAEDMKFDRGKERERKAGFGDKDDRSSKRESSRVTDFSRKNEPMTKKDSSRDEKPSGSQPPDRKGRDRAEERKDSNHNIRAGEIPKSKDSTVPKSRSSDESPIKKSLEKQEKRPSPRKSSPLSKSKPRKNLEVVDSPVTDTDESIVNSPERDQSPVYGPTRSRFESTDDLNGLEEPPPPSPEEMVVQEKEDDSLKLPSYFPAIQGCRSVDEFENMNRIEEGTYGVVYRARDKKTNEIVALKRLKMEKEKEGFPITSLREVSTLLKAHHPNVVAIREVVVGHNMDKIYMVMDFVEHDMKSLMESMRQPFSVGEVKTLLRQLLSAVHHLHDNWIIHRDLKTSNLLLSHQGILKVGDFGLAREYGSPLRPYTPVVVTLWYRAPELLLGIKEYSTPVDMWSVGCIFAEFLTLKPLFPGKSEIEQINKIFKELGNPSEANWPGYTDLPLVKQTNFVSYPYNILRKRFPVTMLTNSGYDLLSAILDYNPDKRLSAEEALKHVHFRDTPLPVDPSMFPTWPARSEQSSAGRRRENTPKPPSGGKQFRETVDADKNDGFRINFGQAKQKGEGFTLRF